MFRERTALAWNRSGLAAAVCAAVLLRHVWPVHGADQALALGLLAAAAIIWIGVLWAITASADRRDEQALVGRTVFGLMTVGTVLLAAAGLVLAFVAAP
jgi:uncharacterized membrane protein YidH (DUF202 family)